MACSRVKFTLTFTTTVSQSYSAATPWSNGKTKRPHAVVNAFVYAPNVPVSNIGPEIDCPHFGLTCFSSFSPRQLCDSALNQSTSTYRGVEPLLFTFLRAISGARGGVVVKALRYEPAGRGFHSRWCHWNFSVT
jgi:hypothetical protein